MTNILEAIINISKLEDLNIDEAVIFFDITIKKVVDGY